LPSWIFEKAGDDKKLLRQLVLDYMRRYPNYTIKKLKTGLRFVRLADREVKKLSKGFISLHRKLKDNPVWTDPNYLKLWIHCLFEASHKDREQLIGNEIVKLKRGQFITGRNALSEEMNRGVKPKQRLNNRTWFRYLQNFETWGMLTIESTNKYSIVTIDNYDTYQGVFNKVVQETDHQLSIKSPTDDQQMSTNNNVNNSNNDNNITAADTHEDFQNSDDVKLAILNKYMQLKKSMHFSPKDEMAAEEIAKEQIPLKDVIKYLEDCFVDYESRKKHKRDTINSLEYCVGYIFDRHYKEQEGKNNVTRIHGLRNSDARGFKKGTSYEQAIREAELARRTFNR